MSETPEFVEPQQPVEGSAAPAPAPTPTDMPEHRDEPTQTDREKDLEHVQNLRKENKSLRDRLKAAEPLAKKAQEAEEAKKDDVQKANERAQALEVALQERDAALARMELAIQYHLEQDDIDFIGSGTREEMDSRAKRIAAKNAAAAKVERPPTDRPVEGLRPGASPEPARPPDDSYPEQWKPQWLRGNDKETSIFHGQ